MYFKNTKQLSVISNISKSYAVYCTYESLFKGTGVVSDNKDGLQVASANIFPLGLIE